MPTSPSMQNILLFPPYTRPVQPPYSNAGNAGRFQDVGRLDADAVLGNWKRQTESLHGGGGGGSAASTSTSAAVEEKRSLVQDVDGLLGATPGWDGTLDPLIEEDLYQSAGTKSWIGRGSVSLDDERLVQEQVQYLHGVHPELLLPTTLLHSLLTESYDRCSNPEDVLERCNLCCLHCISEGEYGYGEEHGEKEETEQEVAVVLRIAGEMHNQVDVWRVDSGSQSEQQQQQQQQQQQSAPSSPVASTAVEPRLYGIHSASQHRFPATATTRPHLRSSPWFCCYSKFILYIGQCRLRTSTRINNNNNSDNNSDNKLAEEEKEVLQVDVAMELAFQFNSEIGWCDWNPYYAGECCVITRSGDIFFCTTSTNTCTKVYTLPSPPPQQQQQLQLQQQQQQQVSSCRCTYGSHPRLLDLVYDGQLFTLDLLSLSSLIAPTPTPTAAATPTGGKLQRFCLAQPSNTVRCVTRNPLIPFHILCADSAYVYVFDERHILMPLLTFEHTMHASVPPSQIFACSWHPPTDHSTVFTAIFLSTFRARETLVFLYSFGTAIPNGFDQCSLLPRVRTNSFSNGHRTSSNSTSSRSGSNNGSHATNSAAMVDVYVPQYCDLPWRIDTFPAVTNRTVVPLYGEGMTLFAKQQDRVNYEKKMRRQTTRHKRKSDEVVDVENSKKELRQGEEVVVEVQEDEETESESSANRSETDTGEAAASTTTTATTSKPKPQQHRHRHRATATVWSDKYVNQGRQPMQQYPLYRSLVSEAREYPEVQVPRDCPIPLVGFDVRYLPRQQHRHRAATTTGSSEQRAVNAVEVQCVQMSALGVVHRQRLLLAYDTIHVIHQLSEQLGSSSRNTSSNVVLADPFPTTLDEAAHADLLPREFLNLSGLHQEVESTLHRHESSTSTSTSTSTSASAATTTTTALTDPLRHAAQQHKSELQSLLQHPDSLDTYQRFLSEHVSAPVLPSAVLVVLQQMFALRVRTLTHAHGSHPYNVDQCRSCCAATVLHLEQAPISTNVPSVQEVEPTLMHQLMEKAEREEADRKQEQQRQSQQQEELWMSQQRQQQSQSLFGTLSQLMSQPPNEVESNTLTSSQFVQQNDDKVRANSTQSEVQFYGLHTFADLNQQELHTLMRSVEESQWE